MELYTVGELTRLAQITRRTAYNWLESGIIPRQAIISRIGHGSKILVDGRIIRHFRTNHPKIQHLQKLLQMKYDEGKNEVA